MPNQEDQKRAARANQEPNFDAAKEAAAKLATQAKEAAKEESKPKPPKAAAAPKKSKDQDLLKVPSKHRKFFKG